MRGIARRLRSSFGIGSSRMAIRSQLAWYWRWVLNLLMMGLVAAVVWWLVQNSYRITGFNVDEARAQIGSLGEENARLKRELDPSRLWVNAYSNDVAFYVASRRLIPEGGYEVDRSMVFYGQPARLGDDTEDRIISTVRTLLPRSFASRR